VGTAVPGPAYAALDHVASGAARDSAAGACGACATCAEAAARLVLASVSRCRSPGKPWPYGRHPRESHAQCFARVRTRSSSSASKLAIAPASAAASAAGTALPPAAPTRDVPTEVPTVGTPATAASSVTSGPVSCRDDTTSQMSGLDQRAQQGCGGSHEGDPVGQPQLASEGLYLPRTGILPTMSR